MKCVVTLSFDLGDDRAEAFRNLLSALDQLRPAPVADSGPLPPRIVLGQARAPTGAEFLRDAVCNQLRALPAMRGCEWSAFVQVTDVDSAWANLSSRPQPKGSVQQWNVVLSETPVPALEEDAMTQPFSSHLRWSVHERQQSAS